MKGRQGLSFTNVYVCIMNSRVGVTLFERELVEAFDVVRQFSVPLSSGYTGRSNGQE